MFSTVWYLGLGERAAACASELQLEIKKIRKKTEIFQSKAINKNNKVQSDKWPVMSDAALSQTINNTPWAHVATDAEMAIDILWILFVGYIFS